jgi:hypothetical protein
VRLKVATRKLHGADSPPFGVKLVFGGFCAYALRGKFVMENEEACES